MVTKIVVKCQHTVTTVGVGCHRLRTDRPALTGQQKLMSCGGPNRYAEVGRDKGGSHPCRASSVAGTFEVSLHELPAKPPFDTQVPMPDVVVEGGGRLDDLIVLDVER
jgi:hypothetical protein